MKKLIIKEINPSIKELVDQCDGYCPCALVRDEDNKCMCKTFKDMDHPGKCFCGRFEKVEVDV